MIRPFRSETERYGQYSKAGEFVYDHPFLWGSKRTGPDLHRIGGKYPDGWHYKHMEDPQAVSPGSIMPPFPWLLKNPLPARHIQNKMMQLQKLGVPYTEAEIVNAPLALREQAAKIADQLKQQHIAAEADREIVALIAYLQRLGRDIRTDDTRKEAPAP
jgi:cytochrome c oxidase cbb3-type subunit I/II